MTLNIQQQKKLNSIYNELIATNSYLNENIVFDYFKTNGLIDINIIDYIDYILNLATKKGFCIKTFHINSYKGGIN